MSRLHCICEQTVGSADGLLICEYGRVLGVVSPCSYMQPAHERAKCMFPCVQLLFKEGVCAPKSCACPGCVCAAANQGLVWCRYVGDGKV